MKFAEAKVILEQHAPTLELDASLFSGGGQELLARVEAEYSIALSPQVTEYLAQHIPTQSVEFYDGREGITLFGSDSVSFWRKGYSYNGREKVMDEQWVDSWLIVAEGHHGWAYLVDFTETDEESPVWMWMEGTFMPSTWQGEEQSIFPVASSLPNFLAILAYQNLWQNEHESREWFEDKLSELEPEQETRDWWLYLVEGGKDNGDEEGEE